jgi:hypothetical protein
VPRGYHRGVGFRRFVQFGGVAALVFAALFLISRRPGATVPSDAASSPGKRAASEAAAIRTAIPDAFPASPPPANPVSRAGAEPAAPSHSRTGAKGNPALFGKLVALGQGLELGEALARNARMADAYVDKLCEEGRKLREHPALPDSSSHDRDAAEFMAPLVDYETPLDDPPGRLHVAEALADRLKSYGADWPTKISDRDLEGLDFGWMSALQRFDHWSLLGAGRLREQPALFDDLSRLPIPNYFSLQQWSKLRLAAAYRRGDLAQASAEVRHLADLTRSQDILIADMVAVAMVRLDARAREVAVAKDLDTAGWPEADPDQLDRHRRIALASLYFTYPGVKPETVRKAASCMPSPCSALLEGAGANRTFGPYGGVDNLDLVSDLAREHGCESATLDRVRRTKELTASEALTSGADDLAQQIPKFFDGLRD